jgi:hypothetical protein
MQRPGALDDQRDNLRSLSWLFGEFDRLIVRGDLLDAQKVLYQVADRLKQMVNVRNLNQPPASRPER